MKVTQSTHTNMKADDARRIRDSLKIDRVTIDQLISASAENGLSAVSFERKQYKNIYPSDQHLKKLSESLETDGFKYRRDQGSDCRDNGSWDTITISW